MTANSLRILLMLLSFAPGLALADDLVSPDKARKVEGDAALWYDLRLLPLEGQAWKDVAAPYDRFPAKAQGKVRDAVWNLSRNSAGICARFVTDSTVIKAKWELTSANLDMPHMPATGVSGLDLYVRDDHGHWRWLANGRPAAQQNNATLIEKLDPKPREYLLYLPLYNGVKSVEIGLDESAKLSLAPAYPKGQQQPIVFYGTSITQGGCASRPGMVHTAILGRQLKYPVVNLGFSGNGQMEEEVGQLLIEIDAAVYVIDCLPNLTGDQVEKRTEPLVKILREAHPKTPILLVEDRTYSDAFLNKSKSERSEASRTALKAAFDRLTKAGDPELYYLTGHELLGDDNEGTVDSSHPTDLGFFRQAAVFEKALRPILEGSK